MSDDKLNFDFRFFKTKERKLFNYNEHALREEFLEYIKTIPADEDEDSYSGGCFKYGFIDEDEDEDDYDDEPKYTDILDQAMDIYSNEIDCDKFVKTIIPYFRDFLKTKTFTDEEISYLYTVCQEYQICSNCMWDIDPVGSGGELLKEDCPYLKSRSDALEIIAGRFTESLLIDFERAWEHDDKTFDLREHFDDFWEEGDDDEEEDDE